MLILLTLIICAGTICALVWFEHRCFQKAYKQGMMHGYKKAEEDFAALLEQWAIEQSQEVRAKLAVILALLRDDKRN